MGKKLKVVLFSILFSLSMFFFLRIKKGENIGKMVLIWSKSTIFLVWEAKVVSGLS